MEFVKEEASPQHFKRRRLFPFKIFRPKKNRIFIFPTGFGFAFGSLATIQLVMAVASQNNLIYLFVFSEIAIALSSMFFTNLNVQRARLSSFHVHSCFALEENLVDLTIAEDSKHPSYQLSVRWKHLKAGQPVLTSTQTTALPWIPPQRGLQKMPHLIIESSFPFSLLRAWKIERLEKKVLVFPQRVGKPTFPSNSLGNESVNNQGIFYDLKPFQNGDWPRRIDWRASQRSQQLLVRRFGEEANNYVHLMWHHTVHIADFEKRISQLTLWIDRAEREGALYSLNIGNWKSGNGRGHHHWALCLEKLAQLEPRDCQ